MEPSNVHFTEEDTIGEFASYIKQGGEHVMTIHMSAYLQALFYT